eukprot:1613504-Amphidinium_carterae.1
MLRHELLELAALIRQRARPALVIGDFNATPREVEQTGVTAIAGLVLLASGRNTTATREIDFGLVTASLA